MRHILTLMRPIWLDDFVSDGSSAMLMVVIRSIWLCISAHSRDSIWDWWFLVSPWCHCWDGWVGIDWDPGRNRRLSYKIDFLYHCIAYAIMQKDFDTWNQQKKLLEIQYRNHFFKTGEIRWTAVGVNIGPESCGKWTTSRRPVKKKKKLSTTSCIVLPVSTQIKTGTRYQTYDLHGIAYCALLYQIRMMSTSRFQRRLWVLDEYDFLQIKEKLKTLLEL